MANDDTNAADYRRLSHKSRKQLKHKLGETMDAVKSETAIGAYFAIGYVDANGDLRLQENCYGLNSAFAQAVGQGVKASQLIGTLGTGEIMPPVLDAAKLS